MLPAKGCDARHAAVLGVRRTRLRAGAIRALPSSRPWGKDGRTGPRGAPGRDRPGAIKEAKWVLTGMIEIFDAIVVFLVY
jgi:hypothetical protein